MGNFVGVADSPVTTGKKSRSTAPRGPVCSSHVFCFGLLAGIVSLIQRTRVHPPGP